MKKAAPGASQAWGILLMLLSCIVLTVGDAISKLLTVTYPVGQVILARSVVIVAIAFGVCLAQRAVAAIKPNSLRNHIRRAGYFVASTFLVNWSFKLMPLPVAHAILFASPIMMTALAPFLLAEKVTLSRWIAVILGFLGVVLIIDPFGVGWQWVAVVPLGGALAAALRDLATREIAGTESTLSLMFSMAVATGAAGLATMPFGGWRIPQPSDLMLMATFGITTTSALYFQVLAFRAAEAGLLAPFKYSTIVWSIVLGIVLWGDFPTFTMLAGIAIVVGSGLFILRREVFVRA
jgi:drug/metabolite transporter (DMT)-like permease